MRAVLDTNVLLSASFVPGICEVLLDVCLTSDDITIVTSEYILAEFTLHGVGKFRAPATQVEAVATILRARCDVVEPASVDPSAFSDADDLPILGTAVAGRADCLVTGDQKLLQLREFRGVLILSPRHFYDRFCR